MNSTIYRQYDKRWSSKPYPNYNSSFGGNGCGCCSVTHIMLEKHSGWTPESCRPYMVKHAVSGQGTTWQGITDSLKHFGATNVTQYWDYSTNVTKAIADLNSHGYSNGQSKRIGIILFSGGAAGSKGVTWTTGGHYLAFTNYKVSGGKHYFYMKDSGPRCHDGWYNYEDHMRGRVSKIWVCDRPVGSSSSSSSSTPSGKLTVDGKLGSATIKRMQKWMGTPQDGIVSGQLSGCKKYIPAACSNWKFGSKASGSAMVKALQKNLGIKADGVWGYNTSVALQKFLNKRGAKLTVDGKFGTSSAKALQRYLNQ